MIEVRVIKKLRDLEPGVEFAAYESTAAILIEQGYVMRCDAPEPVCEEATPEPEPEPEEPKLESDGLSTPKKKRLRRKKRELEVDTNADE